MQRRLVDQQCCWRHDLHRYNEPIWLLTFSPGPTSILTIKTTCAVLALYAPTPSQYAPSTPTRLRAATVSPARPTATLQAPTRPPADASPVSMRATHTGRTSSATVCWSLVRQPRATTEKQRTYRAHFDLQTHSSYHFHSVLAWILLQRGRDYMHRCCFATNYCRITYGTLNASMNVTILRVSQSSTACAAGSITSASAKSECSRTLVSHDPPINSSCAVGTAS